MPPLTITRSAKTRLGIASTAGLVTYFCLQGFEAGYRLVLVWDVFGLVIIVLAGFTLYSIKPAEIRKIATSEDSGRAIIFFLVLIAAAVSLFATLSGIRENDGLGKGQILASLMAVNVSWFLVHISFLFKYAHHYYGDHEKNHKRPALGIDFNNDDEPDYWDFAYLAFTIGMTAQVSDTAIQSQVIRRLVLMHGIISFAFNAVIIALTIGIVSGNM